MLEIAEDDQGGVTARAMDATRMDGERGRAARRDSLLREVPAGEKEVRQEVLGDLVLRDGRAELLIT